ncbi:MAG: hypothetical protein HY365_03345 [Candidatus Aenigmarchaeota archaeon]|nr:hypothetical protein [Candidatus Aenigmarchaeota archaeon]
MQNETKAVIVYGAAGAFAAVASGAARIPINGLFIALLIGALISAALKLWLKPDGYKWLLNNGAYIYAMTWYVLFTLLYNIGGVA